MESWNYTARDGITDSVTELHKTTELRSAWRNYTKRDGITDSEKSTPRTTIFISVTWSLWWKNLVSFPLH